MITLIKIQEFFQESLGVEVVAMSYVRKEGTKDSYIAEPFEPTLHIEGAKEMKAEKERLVAELEGKMWLPMFISFIDDDKAPQIRNCGRGRKARVCQLKGEYRKIEMSPYKQSKESRVATSVWPIEGINGLYYGTIGLSHKKGQKASDNGDLIVFHTHDWEKVDTYVFKGLAESNLYVSLQDVVEVFKKHV